ncbi:uncharacterized protein C8Q71DRAFT_359059 [Rhodofomes roseus]|uniref:Uncharacterized protein n=1 Tax=Rhodofomes roseus TaxID=34475 RepID=A0ABQ8K1P8_9APHY|nr:uncharacterized protein C8Q71DRAFT_359059 [Rhodofomes roseus]KAH9830578.1 hypothetical protein C8Q71DRAFT_359059 [Rhodofomes roseus]
MQRRVQQVGSAPRIRHAHFVVHRYEPLKSSLSMPLFHESLPVNSTRPRPVPFTCAPAIYSHLQPTPNAQTSSTGAPACAAPNLLNTPHIPFSSPRYGSSKDPGKYPRAIFSLLQSKVETPHRHRLHLMRSCTTCSSNNRPLSSGQALHSTRSCMDRPLSIISGHSVSQLPRSPQVERVRLRPDADRIAPGRGLSGDSACGIETVRFVARTPRPRSSTSRRVLTALGSDRHPTGGGNRGRQPRQGVGHRVILAFDAHNGRSRY